MEQLRRLEKQAEAFVAKQTAPAAPPPLSAKELARRLEVSDRRGWLTPHLQFFPAGSDSSSLDLGGFTVSGHAAEALKWLREHDPELHHQLQEKLYLSPPSPATAARTLKRFMFRRGYVRVADSGDCLELERKPTAQQLAVTNEAAQLLGVEVRLL